jgi:hypothetical protein
MRILMALAASLLLALALVAPVAADGPGCSGFGADTAAWAHASGGVGRELSVFARQGMVGAIVASEHADPSFCMQH